MTSKPTTGLWGNLYLKFLFQVENNLFKLQSQNSMQTCPQHSIIIQNSQVGNRLFSFTKYFYFFENKKSLSDYLQYRTGFSDDLVGKKNLPAMLETWVQSLGWEDSLEEGTATHSSILAWRIPMNKLAQRVTVHGVAKSRTQHTD